MMWMIRILLRQNSLLLFAALLLQSSCIFAFPGLLVERPSGCMVDLSTEEVIMNHQVVDHEHSTHPAVKLVSNITTMEFATVPLVVKLKLDLGGPNTNNNLQDVQYAVETSEGAKFTSANSGCDGRRAASQTRRDEGVELTILEPKTIKVWAGWATGHEAVQLTENLVFVPQKEQVKPEVKEEKVVEVVLPKKEVADVPQEHLQQESKEAVKSEAKEPIDLKQETKQQEQVSENANAAISNKVEGVKLAEQKDVRIKKETDQQNADSNQKDLVNAIIDTKLKGVKVQEQNDVRLKIGDLINEQGRFHHQDKNHPVHMQNNLNKQKIKHSDTHPKEQAVMRQNIQEIAKKHKIIQQQEEPKKKKSRTRRRKGILHGYHNENYVTTMDTMQFCYGILFFVGSMFTILLVLESGVLGTKRRKGRRQL